MIKFYYSGAPNPMKVALFLEEAGVPYEAYPDRRPQGRAAQAGIHGDQSERQSALDCRRRRGGVRFQRHPALSRREDRQVHAAQHAEGAGRVVLMADVRRLRRRPLFRAVGAFPHLCAGEKPLRHQPLHVRGATPLRHSRRAARQAEISRRRQLRHCRHGDLGLGAPDPEHPRRGILGQVPEPEASDRRDQRASGGRARQSHCGTSTSSRPTWTTTPSVTCSGT